MDKTDVHFFLVKLEQHMNFDPGLTSPQRKQLRSLYLCVDRMRDYLKMTEKETTRNRNPEVNDLVMNIGDLVFDAEMIVDLFFAGRASDLVTELARVEEEMECLRSELERVMKSMYEADVHFFLEKLEQRINFDRGLTNEQLQSLHRCVVRLRGYLKMTEEETRSELVMNFGELVLDAKNVVDLFFVDAGGGAADLVTELARIDDEMECLMLAEFNSFLEKLEQRINSIDPGLNAEQLGSLYVRMRNFLKMMTELTRNENLEVNELVMNNFGDLVLNAKKVVDLYYADANGGASDVAKEVARIEQGMEGLIYKVERLIANDKTAVVGLEEKVDQLIGELVNQDQDRPLSIRSIVGLLGTGKTTLARKLFDDIRTKEVFPFRGWVTVSQTYQKRDLLIDILKSLCLFDTTLRSDSDLGERLFKVLKGKRYLIVMDDMWSIDAWNDIQRCFPDQRNGSTIIFTSRHTRIGEETTSWYEPSHTHYMNPLSEEDSWKLLQAKIFGTEGSCPLLLEEMGKQIAKQCKGLPLAIVIIGKIIKKDKDKLPERWGEIAKSIDSSVSNKDLLTLSYTHLPLHLKACFLYLGLFPEDHEIPVRQLIWLLIAEGFVTQEDEEDKSLEVTAEGYLNDLVDRSLVMVSRRRSDGSPKAFLIHDIVNDFSFQKGKEEKFLMQQTTSVQNLAPSASIDDRRCYIGSPTILKNKCSPSSLKLRSLVCLTTDKALYCPVFSENHFKLLKVLDLISFQIPFPNDIGNLVLLKYLALWSEVRSLPPSVTKLFNLETLILCTEKTLTLPIDIGKMLKLRHLYNKMGPFCFHRISSLETETKTNPDHESRGAYMLENLQTLHPLCPCKSCTKFLVRTPKIKKLGLSGDFVSWRGSFLIPRNLIMLEQLESLSFINTSLYLHRSTDLVKLELPSCLKRLTLRNTFLKWEEISVLGDLENLEVLKLLDDACVVSDELSEDEADWDTIGLEFPRLKYLKMRRLDITKWDDAELGFYSLEVLVLEECQQLQVIPSDLAQVPTLRTIEVRRCNPLLEDCARGIVEEHQEQCGDDDLRAFIIS